MSQCHSNFVILKKSLVVSLLVAVVAYEWTAAGETSPVKQPEKQETGQANQLFELRIYTAAPGKMEALHTRFREHTLRLFEKHGIKSVGYWSATDTEGREQLYYMVAYPDQESREKMLINGIAKDPVFLKVVKDSEKEGKLTTKVESVLLTPTDYSALK